MDGNKCEATGTRMRTRISSWAIDGGKVSGLYVCMEWNSRRKRWWTVPRHAIRSEMKGERKGVRDSLLAGASFTHLSGQNEPSNMSYESIR